MSKPNSPAAQETAPNTKGKARPPAGIRGRGILSVSENCGQGDRLKTGDLLWRYFGRDLCREFYR